jgi:hypothetical protein
MADNMSIDKKDPSREGSEDSMDLNSPTPEAETGAPQENVGQQKRKGGRKPVRFVMHYPAKMVQKLICCDRSMLPRKNENSAIVKRRQLLGSAVRSILSNWRRPSVFMKPISIAYRLLTGVLRMNVSC